MSSITKEKTYNKKVVFFLISFAFLDTAAVTLVILQIMPRLLAIGASPILAGIICATYGGVQLFSSPLVGSLFLVIIDNMRSICPLLIFVVSSNVTGGLADKMNVKKLLFVSLIASAANYYLMSYQSLVLFSIARLILGGVKNTQLLAQSYLSDIVPVAEKGAYFGYFGAGIGLGFIVGPAVAGHIAEWEDGFSTSAKLTALWFILNAGLVWFLLPDLPRKNVATENSKKKESNGIVGYLKNVGFENIWDLLLLQFLSEFATFIYFSIFIDILIGDYGLSNKSFGYLLAFTSICGMVVAIFSGKLSKIGGNYLIPVSMVVIFVSLALLVMLPAFSLVVIALLCITGGLGLLRTLWPNMLTERSSPDKAGTVVGLSHSIMAVSGMLSPIVAGIATEVFNTSNGATAIGAFVGGVGVLSTFWLPIKTSQEKKKS